MEKIDLGIAALGGAVLPHGEMMALGRGCGQPRREGDRWLVTTIADWCKYPHVVSAWVPVDSFVGALLLCEEMTTRRGLFSMWLVLAIACDVDGDDGHDHDGETEVISRVELTFTPQGGGTAITAMFDDPDGDGGVSGMADAITLPTGTTFELDVEFLNALVDPPVDISHEIEHEAEGHQVLVLGDAVSGPASMSASAVLEHAYADLESDYGDNATGSDLPVGLHNTATTVGTGSGTLRVMLRHMPTIDGAVQKSDDVAELAAMDRPLPGDVDADVTFALTVQ